jgi:hypothetical protein
MHCFFKLFVYASTLQHQAAVCSAKHWMLPYTLQAKHWMLPYTLQATLHLTSPITNNSTTAFNSKYACFSQQQQQQQGVTCMRRARFLWLMK